MSRAAPGRYWHDGCGRHLDTRGLPPPEPMVAVLWHLECDPSPLTVYLDREPIYLFPELTQRGWRWEVTRRGGSVRLLLRHGS